MSAAEWIAKRRELLDAATEGPWVAEYSSLHRDCVVPHDARSTREAVAQTRLLRAAGDARFIADARTALPRALDALEAALGMANAGAITSRARGDSEEERRWLDLLITIESVLRGES